MSDFPWLRLYNETLSDRKIARICRDTGQPKALVIGVWATLLMLASESPRRGELLISDDLPLSADEIRDETGLDADVFDGIVGGLSAYGLIDTAGDCWTICNWEKRQPPSDSSTKRVQEHRRRKREGNAPSLLQTLPDETLRQRYGNALDQEGDKDPDQEGEGETARSAPAPAPLPAFQPVPEEVQRQKARKGITEPEPAIVSTAPAALKMFHELTNYWPGADNAPLIVQSLGDAPDKTLLARAVELWRASGNKITNWLGMCDWYHELSRNPTWTPQDRFKNGNGSAGYGKTTTPPASVAALKPLGNGLF